MLLSKVVQSVTELRSGRTVKAIGLLLQGVISWSYSSGSQVVLFAVNLRDGKHSQLKRDYFTSHEKRVPEPEPILGFNGMSCEGLNVVHLSRRNDGEQGSCLDH